MKEILKRRKNETAECFSLRVAKLEQKKQKTNDQAEVIVDKNRHGPIGTIKLIFKGEFLKFDNLTEEKYLSFVNSIILIVINSYNNSNYNSYK